MSLPLINTALDRGDFRVNGPGHDGFVVVRGYRTPARQQGNKPPSSGDRRAPQTPFSDIKYLDQKLTGTNCAHRHKSISG